MGRMLRKNPNHAALSPSAGSATPMAKEFSIVMHYRLPSQRQVCGLFVVCSRDGVPLRPAWLGARAVPLCIFQRVAVIAVGLVALLAAWRNPVYRAGQPVCRAGLAGGRWAAPAVAAWHVKLQLLTPADKIPACGPAWTICWKPCRLPICWPRCFAAAANREIKLALAGPAITVWSLASFVAMALLALWLLRRRA